MRLKVSLKSNITLKFLEENDLWIDYSLVLLLYIEMIKLNLLK